MYVLCAFIFEDDEHNEATPYELGRFEDKQKLVDYLLFVGIPRDNAILIYDDEGGVDVGRVGSDR